MMVALGCVQADSTCLAQISRILKERNIIYGDLQKTGHTYTLNLYFYQANNKKIGSKKISGPISNSNLYNKRAIRSYLIRLLSKHTKNITIDLGISHVKVSLDKIIQGFTNEEGRISLERITLGDHTLQCIHKNFEPFAYHITAKQKDPFHTAIDLEKAFAQHRKNLQPKQVHKNTFCSLSKNFKRSKKIF